MEGEAFDMAIGIALFFVLAYSLYMDLLNVMWMM